MINNLKIGLISDLHLHRKPDNVIKALKCVCDADILLLAGDLADSGEKEQYSLLRKCLDDIVPLIPVFCVSGNHDNPNRDDSNYRDFTASIRDRTEGISVTEDNSGAYKAVISEKLDLFGLNPVYHQKAFSFPNRGEQLAFLEKELALSEARYHIIMCHPPLIAHNPQRDRGQSSYFSPEQDSRLQSVADSHSNILFLSGHTHITPSVEPDSGRNNLYINNGSICPTTVKDGGGQTQQGNVTMLEFSDDGLSVRIFGIHTKKELYYRSFVEMGGKRT